MATVVAFMQNPWWKSGARRARARRYNSDQAYHKRVLLLSMSGRRLMRAFGRREYWAIWWENASLQYENFHGYNPGYDLRHILKVLREQRPGVVLTFGNVAREGVRVAVDEVLRWDERRMRVMGCHHPNARHRTQADLDEFARKVKNYTRRKKR